MRSAAWAGHYVHGCDLPSNMHNVTILSLNMKKIFIPLVLLSSVGIGATPEWSLTQSDPSHVTYTTTQTGSYTFDSLGEAAITEGESFSITLKFTCSSDVFLQNDALSFIAAKNGSTSDLYDISGGNDQFRLYIRKTNQAFHFSVNGWVYGNETGKTEFDGFTWAVPSEISADSPFCVGVTFTYVNGTDAPDGDNYFTISATEDSQIQFAAQTDKNVVRSFNFSDLTNETKYSAAPSDLQTTISITKSGVLVPEPTSGILSALALAGLCARRRRK